MSVEKHAGQQESRIMKILNHPNIVRYFSHGVWNLGKQKFLFMVIELCNSGCLKMALADIKTQYSNMNHEKYHKFVAKIYQDIIRALLYLHKTKGIIHFDVKPSNILICDLAKNRGVSRKRFDEQLVFKLCDFGCSRSVNQHDSYVCTLRYAAPEVLMHYYDKVSSAADIYSFALVILECFTFEKPG